MVGDDVMSEYMFRRYEEYRDKYEEYKGKYEAALREITALKNTIGFLTGSSEQEVGKNPNILKLSALDGTVVISGDTVCVADGEGLRVEVCKDEWDALRAEFRLDDVVDYESGETPMTTNQFQICVKLFRETKRLKAEAERIKAENGTR